MAFDETLFERFAVLASEHASQNEPDAGVDVFEIGKLLNLSGKDSMAIAMFLEECGWAKIEYGQGFADQRDEDGLNAAWLKLTLLGHREIIKLKRPRWKRWLESNFAVASAVIAAITTILVAVAIEFVKRWLWPV